MSASHQGETQGQSLVISCRFVVDLVTLEQVSLGVFRCVCKSVNSGS
jgi:hypothetical protein